MRTRAANALRGATSIVVLGVACVCCAPTANAVPQLTQLAHSAWRTQDGLLASPNAIAQTADGYIWVGTDRGLTRFDGVRFVPSNALTGLTMPEFRVSSLLATRDESLWVGAGSNLVQIRHGVAVTRKIVALPAQLHEDAEGKVWFAGLRHPGASLCGVVADAVVCHGPALIGLQHATTVERAPDGALWLGSSTGLCRWLPGDASSQCFLQKTFEQFQNLEGVNALLSASDGTLWVGIGRAGPNLGLGHLVDGEWRPFHADGMDGSTLSVSALIEDRSGAIWVGTLDQGLYRIADGRVDRFRSADGLSSNAVVGRGIFEDREGIVWVLTTAGIDNFRERPVAVYSTREGLPSDGVESVLPRRNGDVWFGNNTLSILRDGRHRPPDDPGLFAGKAVTSMLEDREGNVWIGLDQALAVYENGALTDIPGLDGKPLGVVVNLAQDTVGDIWASTVGEDPQVVRIRARRVVERMDRERFGNPRAIASDPRGGIWIGSNDGRLASFKDGHFNVLPPELVNKGIVRHLAVDDDGTVFGATSLGLLILKNTQHRFVVTANGLPCSSFSATVLDRNKSLWINASCGLIKIEAAELARWSDAPGTRLQTLLLDTTDGAQSVSTTSFVPSAAKAPDGRLWFATSRFAEVVDPEAITRTAPAVPLHIEELKADRQVFAPSSRIMLPSDSRDVSIRYTALAFRAPQKTQFRYRLEGRDVGWEDVGTRREAFYTDLPPGAYRFEVKASDETGVFGDETAHLAFEIPPLFYQTRWFVVTCAIAAFVVALGLVRLRVRKVARRVQQQMRVKMLERERIARDLHDTLLQDTQALVLSFQTVAEQLPADAPARQLMERTLDRADQILAEGRDCVLDLRDPDAKLADLPEALSLVGEELAKSGVGEFRTIVEGHARPLTAGVRDEAYRIGREALINAFQHAQAKHIEVQINFGVSALVLQIRDDGRGIDPVTLESGRKAGHWGLIGMRERARELGGTLEIWSGSRPGTEIELQVPANIAYLASDAASASWFERWRGKRAR